MLDFKGICAYVFLKKSSDTICVLNLNIFDHDGKKMNKNKPQILLSQVKLESKALST